MEFPGSDPVGLQCGKYVMRPIPPILALIFEKTSLSQNPAILPPDKSPLSRAAFLELYAVSNSFLLMGLLA